MRINFFSTTINSSAQKKVNLILKKGKISSGQQSESFESSFSNTFNILFVKHLFIRNRVMLRCSYKHKHKRN